MITATICFKTWMKYQKLKNEKLKDASFSLSEQEEDESSEDSQESFLYSENDDRSFND